MFYQTLKDIENAYRDVGGYGLTYDGYKDLCRKSWQDEYNHLCVDRSKEKDQERYCVCDENKNIYNECTLETKAF